MDKKMKNELFKVAIDYLFNKKKVISQKELALKIGITEPSLSRIMNGTRVVSDETLRKMNESFGGIFNMAYFRGESTNFLIEDEVHYQKHPEENPFRDFDEQLKRNVQKIEQPQQSVMPSALDYSFAHETIAVLRQQISDKNEQIADLRADKQRLIKESDAKDVKISGLQARIQELEAYIKNIATEDPLHDFPFPFGVADKGDKKTTHV